MSKGFKWLFLILALMVPNIVMAGVFDVSPNDKSMQYLGQVFGSMGSLPLTASGNPLISQLYYLFNEIVFALAIVIIIVTTVIGTINTAQEGEALGKKMSSVWIPARAGIGVYLLLPSVGGYNWIQLTVMWLIVQGVGAANALWKQTLESLSTQGSIVADTRKADVTNMLPGLTSIFKSTLCMQAFNDLMIKDPIAAKNMNNDFIQVTALKDLSGIQFARSNPGPNEAPLCGTITIPDVGTNPLSTTNNPNDPVVIARKQSFVDALLLAEQSMEPAAAEALAPNSSSSTWQYANLWVSAARVIQGAAENIAQQNNPSSPTVTGAGGYSQNYEQAIEDGWIHAGNYYGQMVRSGNYKNVTVSLGNTNLSQSGLDTLLGSSVADPIIQRVTGLGADYTTPGSYAQYVNTLGVISPAAALSGSTPVLQVNTPDTGDANASRAFSAILGGSFFSDAAAQLGTTITTGCLVNSSDPNSQLGDPIECMAVFGSKLANSAEMAFWIAMGVALGIWLAVSIMKGCQPLGWGFDKLLAIIMPIAAVMLLLVWTSGVTLALYVPLIPLLVFTFSAISWVLLVIESMLGAPLIALTLIIPSEDEIGKAGHAIVILLGLFLRPALMILGFIFGQKVLMVAIGILNFGFSGALKMSLVSGVGPFGFIAILMMYTAIAVALVHESFSLIYVLPDKVVRWMGGQGEGSEAGHLAKEMQAAHDKGAQVGESAMKGGFDTATKAISGD
ncbi:MAG: DotA/TraY family protein [Proteobacteria bacterium]|nr:DotA/TraY family protein [Pseudomonadota bacterium]